MPAPLPSTDELMAIVHRYYPTGLDPDQQHEAYLASPEWRRFCDLSERVMRLEVLPRWDEFRAALKTALPDCSFWDTSVPHYDGCRRFRSTSVLPKYRPDNRNIRRSSVW